MIPIRNVYFLKLGAKGAWADDAIENGLLRFGWVEIPLALIHAGDWPAIRTLLTRPGRPAGAVTADTERLRDLAESTPDDVWLTFHKSHLYWCRVADGPVERDRISSFRRLSSPWRNTDTQGSPLLTNAIPGQISKVQGFRGTVCGVRERDIVGRLLSGELSPQAMQIANAEEQLVSAVAAALKGLHWKDFETLVDLVFRQAGWRRRSVLGESMAFADLELEEAITGDRYQVQVKARAGRADLEEYAERFAAGTYRRLFFVVHSPEPSLASAPTESLSAHVDLVLPERLASLVVAHGLAGWVRERVR